MITNSGEALLISNQASTASFHTSVLLTPWSCTDIQFVPEGSLFFRNKTCLFLLEQKWLLQTAWQTSWKSVPEEFLFFKDTESFFSLPGAKGKVLVPSWDWSHPQARESRERSRHQLFPLNFLFWSSQWEKWVGSLPCHCLWSASRPGRQVQGAMLPPPADPCQSPQCEKQPNGFALML